MYSRLVKHLLEISAKPHSLLLEARAGRVSFGMHRCHVASAVIHYTLQALWRRTLPLPSLQEIDDVLGFVCKLNWTEVHTTHCLETVCAISSRDGSTSQCITKF